MKTPFALLADAPGLASEVIVAISMRLFSSPASGRVLESDASLGHGLVALPLEFSVPRAHSWSCSPVRCSPSDRAGVQTPGLLQLAYPVLAVRDLQEPSKNLAAMLTQSPAASPRPQHCEILLKGHRLPGSLLDVLGWCFPSTDGGGGSVPYASPQRARSADAVTRLTALPCGPRSVKASLSFSSIN